MIIKVGGWVDFILEFSDGKENYLIEQQSALINMRKILPSFLKKEFHTTYLF